MQIYYIEFFVNLELCYFSVVFNWVFNEFVICFFISSLLLGIFDSLEILDFFFLFYIFDSQMGVLLVGLCVLGWEGVEEVQFCVLDCSYFVEFQDMVIVLFCLGFDMDGDGLCDQLDLDFDDVCNFDVLNGNCDVDGDGVYVDVDFDDGDFCNLFIEVEVLSVVGLFCLGVVDGYVEIGLIMFYCSGGCFDIYLEEVLLLVQ